MDKKLQDSLTTILSVVGPVILGLVYQYQSQILGYFTPYGPTVVGLVGAGLAIVSVYYTKQYMQEKAEIKSSESEVKEGEGAV